MSTSLMELGDLELDHNVNRCFLLIEGESDKVDGDPFGLFLVVDERNFYIYFSPRALAVGASFTGISNRDCVRR